MVHVNVDVSHQGVCLAADYLKTLTEKYVRLPKLLDFLFRFSVDSVTTVPARSVQAALERTLRPRGRARCLLRLSFCIRAVRNR